MEKDIECSSFEKLIDVVSDVITDADSFGFDIDSEYVWLDEMESGEMVSDNDCDAAKVAPEVDTDAERDRVTSSADTVTDSEVDSSLLCSDALALELPDITIEAVNDSLSVFAVLKLVDGDCDDVITMENCD